jgi:hypothetical protein
MCHRVYQQLSNLLKPGLFRAAMLVRHGHRASFRPPRQFQGQCPRQDPCRCSQDPCRCSKGLCKPTQDLCKPSQDLCKPSQDLFKASKGRLRSSQGGFRLSRDWYRHSHASGPRNRAPSRRFRASPRASLQQVHADRAKRLRARRLEFAAKIRLPQPPCLCQERVSGAWIQRQIQMPLHSIRQQHAGQRLAICGSCAASDP